MQLANYINSGLRDATLAIDQETARLDAMQNCLLLTATQRTPVAKLLASRLLVSLNRGSGIFIF
jgi:hypothetical protein